MVRVSRLNVGKAICSKILALEVTRTNDRTFNQLLLKQSIKRECWETGSYNKVDMVYIQTGLNGLLKLLPCPEEVNWAQGGYLESDFIKPGNTVWVPDERQQQ